MKNRSSRGGKEGDGGLTLGDFRLWRDFTHDIDSYEDHDWDEMERVIAAHSPGTEIIRGSVPEKPKAASLEQKKTITPSQNPQLDARTEQRIRRGKMPIDGKLDLHGYKQDEAYDILSSFITRAHADGKRCLLIITGKGKGSSGGAWYDIPEGVLKQKTPQWLSSPPLKNMVLKIFPAHRTHGGEGAMYVYLKRQRENSF